jgi:hypothetical protein
MSDSALMPTFEVDKEGLARIVGRKGKSFVLTELLQNAWDEDSTLVDVALRWLEEPTDAESHGLAELVVEDDDPDGFTNIAHAYTLFADSEKKADAEKRGRFNIGEKYVIAVCDQAVVDTTTGIVIFEPKGRIMQDPIRDKGSKFVGQLRLTRDEYAEVEDVASRLIPPDGVVTTFNGQELAHREPVRVIEDRFWTEFGPDLKRTIRKAEARLHEPVGDERAMIYEMGIPVVETGDRFHVDVQQKVPLNVERDNVTPAFLRDVRRIVVNQAHDLLTEDDGGAGWVTDALEDEEVSPVALGAALKLRFGDKIVSRDPSDPEANKIAASEGYTVLSSGSLPPAVWKNVKAHGIVKPAGQVTPSPKPYLPGQANVRKVEPEEKWTPGMVRVAEFSRQMAEKILGAQIVVEYVNDPDCLNFRATYGRGPGPTGKLEYNLRVLGRKWFDLDVTDPLILGLLFHELAHHHEGDHLSSEYHYEIERIAARAVRLALDEPDFYHSLAAEAASA